MNNIYFFPKNIIIPNFLSKSGIALNLICDILRRLLYIRKYNYKYNKKQFKHLQNIYFIYNFLFYAKMRSSIVTEEMLKKYIK
jgi:hypothetical protein